MIGLYLLKRAPFILNGRKSKMKEDKSSWAIGGTTLIGIGVGFFLLHMSPLFFVASILVGVGVGLVLAPVLSK
jgi:hypothetical protein